MHDLCVKAKQIVKGYFAMWNFWRRRCQFGYIWRDRECDDK